MFKFESTSIFDFQDKFKTDNECKAYLYHFKWKDGFACVKCGHTHSWDNTVENGKVCKNCRKIHSVTSGTIFHGVRFPLRTAFYIIFEMASSTKSISALQIARRYNINRKTAWLFMRKYRASLKSSQEYKMTNGDDDSPSVLYVDEFVVGGYEQGKAGRTNSSKKRKMMMVVEATKKNGIKRVYGMKIHGYSGKDLQQLFDKHIAKGSTVITDGWRGYDTVNGYNIIKDVKGMKKVSNPMNRMIQQYKSWIRGVYHKSTHQHIESYLNEFCFRINRSLWKENMFHAAILKGISHAPLTRLMIPDVHRFV